VAIESVEDLRAHLALATRVELSTIPLYLFAMYSIKDQECDAARLIASVVVEEMLHVCLVSNVLLAVGGEPDFGYEAIPEYPGLMLHHTPDLPLVLEPCTRDLVRNTFMAIESPRAPLAPPEDDVYETLGQFYAALEEAVDTLNEEDDLFVNHQPGRQLSDPSFYAPVKFDAEDSGGLMLVSDDASADEAFEIIIEQGEGLSDHRWADPDHQELTHFYKFEQIASGLSPIGDVWPVRSSPKSSDFPEPIAEVSQFFNALYGLMFVTMRDLFSGEEDQGAVIGRLYGLMTGCMTPTARYLVAQPISGGEHAGPTFEVYHFADDPWSETIRLADSVVHDHPELEAVVSIVHDLGR
ncbi:MAG: ferritin-like protein, partial [Actinomycetia bacterium]|nr:ferritin-like protein [Actinomycetes bacterium]